MTTTHDAESAAGQAVYAILPEIGRWSAEQLEREMAALERVHGPRVYAELIDLLSSLRFPEGTAKRYWDRFAALRERMEADLGRRVDPRVVLIDHFLDVEPRLENPKIVEFQLFESTKAMAYRDGLTGLFNQRSFREHLAQEIARGKQLNLPVSLLLVDVDHFKQFNDRHGHLEGDGALAAVAGLIVESLREGDHAARYGGEEFAVILPATMKTGAQMVAERIRSAVANHTFLGGADPSRGRLSVSVGVSTWPADGTDATQAVRSADQALYAAKSAGRNRVELFGGSRRSFRRVRVAVGASVALSPGRSEPTTVVEMSEGGARIVLPEPVPPGSLVDLTFRLPSNPEDFRAAARVIHVRSAGEALEAAVRFVHLDAPDRFALTSFLSSTRRDLDERTASRG